MDSGGGSDPPRQDKGKGIARGEPKRRRNRSANNEVVINLGNMRSSTLVGPPMTTTSDVPPAHSPSGPNWFHIPSHGHMPPLGYTAGHMPLPGYTAGHMPPSGYTAPYMPPGYTAPYTAGLFPPPPGYTAGHTPPEHIGTSTEHISTSTEHVSTSEDDHVGGDGANEPGVEVVDDERVEVVYINNKKLYIIYPYGNTLVPSKAASSSITYVIQKKYFQTYHKKWSKVDDKVKDELLAFFRNRVTWHQQYDEEVRRCFLLRFGQQLSDLLYKLRCGNVRPPYMGENVWNAFKEHWETEKFKHNSEKAKANRNSEKGGSLNCVGSISQAQHAIRLAKKLGRPPTAAELHRFTHVRKGTQDHFVEERARVTQEAHSQEMGSATQGNWNPETSGQLTPDLIALSNAHWEKVAGWNKGRLYGTGPLAPLMSPSGVDPTRASRRRPPFSTQSDSERERFRKMEEELHATQQKLEESERQKLEWQQMMEMQKQEWEQKMENDMRRMMELYQSQQSTSQPAQKLGDEI